MSCIKIALTHIPKAIAVFCLVFTSSHLNAAWTTPVQISTSNSDSVNIAVDISGNAVGVWQGYDGNNYIIESASLPFLGNWSSSVSLSMAEQDAQAPEVAVNSLGDAVCVWSRYDGTDSIIQASQKVFGSSWVSAVNISTSGGNANGVEVSMDYSGTAKNAVAVWHRYNGTNFIIQSSELPSGGSWSDPVNISPSGQDALVPEVCVDPSGNAVVVCSRYDGSAFTTRSIISLNGDTWGPSIVLSEPGDAAITGNVSVDQAGNAIVVWNQFDGTHYIIKSSAVPYGGNWSTPINLSEGGQNAFIPTVDSDPIGNAVIAWIRFDGANYIAQASAKLSDGTWTTPTDLSSVGKDVRNVNLIINQYGQAVIMWDETDGTNSVVYSSRHFVNGLWSAPMQVSLNGAYAYLPVVDIDDAGNAVAIWLEFDGTDSYVWGSTLPF